MSDTVSASAPSGGARTSPTEVKLGTFVGVFTPTLLTVLGAIMYLREGWVVGNAGLIGALTIISLAHVITITTGLSVSSVATNTKVGAGGAFAIISQSLGLEVGGSVGAPLFFAQSISVVLYILAFTEAWVRQFPAHHFVAVALLTFAVVCGIAFISTQFAARTTFLILVVVIVSLFSIALAAFPILGQEGLTHTPVLWGDFGAASYWETFAIFFPAVTGIMTGISLSGDLEDPRSSIPRGTMSAIFIGFGIYVLLAYWLAAIATPEELISTSTIMIDKAYYGPAILAGMLGATFSSALGSMIAAPRVMQALARQELLPRSAFFARLSKRGEPRNAMLATTGIGFFGLLIALASGGLDAVAGVISMFFLITYCMLNLVVLIELQLNMISFRPTLKIPRSVPFVGTIGCLFVMFLINPVFSLVAIALVLAIYFYMGLRSVNAPAGDVRSGLFLTISEWAAIRSRRMPAAPERTWKPTVLVPVESTAEFTGHYEFLRSMAAPQGSIHALGIASAGEMEALDDLGTMVEAFMDEGIFARRILLEDEDFVAGIRSATQVLRETYFRPNILFLSMNANSDQDRLQRLADETAAYDMGVVILARHPVIELGRRYRINVWIRSQSADWGKLFSGGNQDLSILLAYQLRKNWQGHIGLCMAVEPQDMAQAEDYLTRLKTETRLPADTSLHVYDTGFDAALKNAPRADLSIFGLPTSPDLEFCLSVVEAVDGSCAFVRDSDEESALA